MIKNTNSASIRHIVFISYVVITAPAVLLAYSMVQSINDEFYMHAKFISAVEVENVSDNGDRWFVALGAFLRKSSVPFSKTTNGLHYEKGTELHQWTEHLQNTRVAVIYSWASLFTFGLIVYFALGTSLNKVFRELTLAIDNLSNHRLHEEINIDSRFAMTELSDSLENLRLQMNNDEQEQQRYLRHISHEIKTPLTSIKEGSMLLDQQVMGSMNDDQQEVASILVRSSVELQRAVENLLDYNAAIRFKEYSSRTKVDLANLVKQALQNNQLSIKQKKINVTLKLNQSESFVDRRQMTSVFDNLISNALKHSPFEGEISISLFNNKAGFHCFEISDNGQGIRTHDKDYIFDPFYVGAHQTETTLKGTGLGLSIAKQYIEDHKGELRLVESEIGAVFKASIPAS